jgi:release factor glutamine methyltransferase
MTLQDAHLQLIFRLSSIYGENEAQNISGWVLEKLTGWNRIGRITHKEDLLSLVQQQQLEKYTKELLQHRPVQYVLEEAWFAGMKFYVNEQVLIPRPETEELVEWIINDYQQSTTSNQRGFLDIGTGSGCIPVALKKKFPTVSVFACDISEDALAIAASNAKRNDAAIQYIQCNILNEDEWERLPEIDVIVSNPPYIPLRDKAAMQENVLGFEPPLALFVPDEDPLLFYKTIAELAIVKKTTALYFEIHEEQGEAIVELLRAKGFNEVKLKKDMQGKDRMIKAVY